MNALPFEYCGWSKQGTAIWSKGFPKMFGLATIQNIRDIQQAILPSDAAALEGMIFSLKKEGEPFTLNVTTNDNDRTLTLYGRQGCDLDGFDNYDVLWVEDTTMFKNEQDELFSSLADLQKDIHEYRVVLDNLPQSVWITDDSGKLEWCNKMYEQTVQKERDNLIGEDDIFNPILTDPKKISVMEMARQAWSTNEIEASTGRLIVNGKRRLMDVHIAPSKKEQFMLKYSSFMKYMHHLSTIALEKIEGELPINSIPQDAFRMMAMMVPQHIEITSLAPRIEIKDKFRRQSSCDERMPAVSAVSHPLM